MCQTLTHVHGVFDCGKHHRGLLGRREKEGSRLRSGSMLFRALFVWQGIGDGGHLVETGKSLSPGSLSSEMRCVFTG